MRFLALLAKYGPAMQSGRTATVCLVGACLLLIVGLFVWFDNPTVDVSATDLGAGGPAGEVGCSIAPWDAILNHNRDGPGGEHSHPYSDEVAADCYAANMTRFDAAVGSAVLALLILSISALVAIRSMRRMPTTQQ